jgi:hypothetical protein
MRYLKKPLPAHSGELVGGEPTSRNSKKREILMFFEIQSVKNQLRTTG